MPKSNREMSALTTKQVKKILRKEGLDWLDFVKWITERMSDHLSDDYTGITKNGRPIFYARSVDKYIEKDL
jgi:NAD(P)H-flavin reductase